MDARVREILSAIEEWKQSDPIEELPPLDCTEIEFLAGSAEADLQAYADAIEVPSPKEGAHPLKAVGVVAMLILVAAAPDDPFAWWMCVTGLLCCAARGEDDDPSL